MAGNRREYWDRVGYRILLLLMVLSVVGFGAHALLNRPGPPAGWNKVLESENQPQTRPRQRYTLAFPDYAGELRHNLSQPVPARPAALGEGFASGAGDGGGEGLAIPEAESEEKPE